MQSLHEHLADLSASAKRAEEAVMAARRETRDRVAVRREQARASAEAMADRVDKELSTASETFTTQWHTLQAKVAADIDRLRNDHSERQRNQSVKRAADRAARLETDAGVAIDYALASIEEAKLAVLDAVLAAIEAAEAEVS
ncbi:MAG: hypothetical protein ACJ796_15760 [Gemmatimonadaceae bacterium]|jgi:hypothetical protein